jgi:hypothetical protein
LCGMESGYLFNGYSEITLEELVWPGLGLFFSFFTSLPRTRLGV